MIINNQEILECYWNSNTPNDVVQFMCDKDTKLIAINDKQLTSALIVTQDLITKEVKLYFGITEVSNEIGDIKFILDWGAKLEGYSLDNLSRLFNLNNKEEK